MTNFDLLLLHDAIGMIILVFFSLLCMAMAKTTSMRVVLSIYVVLQFLMFSADFMFISRL